VLALHLLPADGSGGSELQFELAHSQLIGRTEQCCDKSHEPVSLDHHLARNPNRAIVFYFVIVRRSFVTHLLDAGLTWLCCDWNRSPNPEEGSVASTLGLPNRSDVAHIPTPGPFVTIRFVRQHVPHMSSQFSSFWLTANCDDHALWRWRSTVNSRRCLPNLLAVLFLTSTSLASLPTPPAYFELNCSSCHKVGEGPSVGPDLKGVTQRAPRHWLIGFIRNPDAKIAAKDPYATRIVTESQGMVMPGFPDVSEEFGEGLLEYIDQQSCAPTPPTRTAGSGDPARGRELFLGKGRLSNGAAACIACHQASGLPLVGGRLGPDLSVVHRKLGGDRGLASWLRNPPSPLMSTIFRAGPLTAEEAADLAAFLRTTVETSRQLSEAPLRRVQAIGLGGSLLAFVIAGAVWRGRLDGVRRHVAGKRGGQ